MEIINCIEINPDVNYTNIVKKDDFTTNKNYIGFDKELNVPVYINEKLKKGEIKKIMSTEFKELQPGSYKANVIQVYSKKNIKDVNKECLIIELNVNNEKQYVTFFMKGYNDIQMEISKKKIDDILSRFEINDINELVGKDVTLLVKKNDKGYINSYIYPQKNYMNWTDNCQLPCSIVRISKSKDDSKYFVSVKISFNSQIYDDYVVYNTSNEWDMKSFDRILSKIPTKIEEILNKDIDLKAIFKVVKNPNKNDPTKFYINKRIIFENNMFKTSVYKIHKPNK